MAEDASNMERRRTIVVVSCFLVAAATFVALASLYWMNQPESVLKLAIEAKGLINDYYIIALIIYATLALVVQLQILPIGTLTVFIACLLVGPIAATSIYFLAMIVAIWPVYWVMNKMVVPAHDGAAELLLARIHPHLGTIPSELRRQGVLLSMALRLMPIFPSAVAAAAAALLGIEIRHLVLGTVLSAWIKLALIATSALAVESIAQALYNPINIEIGGQSFLLAVLTAVACVGITVRAWVGSRLRGFVAKDGA